VSLLVAVGVIGAVAAGAAGDQRTQRVWQGGSCCRPAPARLARAALSSASADTIRRLLLPSPVQEGAPLHPSRQPGAGQQVVRSGDQPAVPGGGGGVDFGRPADIALYHLNSLQLRFPDGRSIPLAAVALHGLQQQRPLGIDQLLETFRARCRSSARQNASSVRASGAGTAGIASTGCRCASTSCPPSSPCCVPPARWPSAWLPCGGQRGRCLRGC